MEIFKVLILGVIISIITVFLKQIKPEYSLIAVIVGSIILLIYIINAISDVFAFFGNIVDTTGIDNTIFITLIKIIGIGYLIEFCAGICTDSGNTSIADKIVLAGKIIIFMVSMPIITKLFDMILELM